MFVQNSPCVSNYNSSYVSDGISPNFRSSKRIQNERMNIVDILTKEGPKPKKNLFKKFLDFIKKIRLYSKFEALNGKFLKKTEAKGVTKALSKCSEKGLRKNFNKYIRGLKTGESVDPEKIVEIAKKSGATVNELEFIKTAEYPVGRKQEIIMGGKRYILETHNEKGFPDSTTTSVTRLYTPDKNVNEREYLTINGTFEKGQHYSPCSHFDTGLKGRAWINKKPKDKVLDSIA